VSLGDELDQAAGAASVHGIVTGVLAAEAASGHRAYLVALGQGDRRAWLVLDADLEPVVERNRVREVASIVVLCGLAGELAGGGRLDDLRARLANLRLTEQPQGIEQAEGAALELERTIGAPPRVASPDYLDAVGAATRSLEEALGEHESPFATALAASSGTVESFVSEVEGRNSLPLR
jgi:hypothetical protein